MAQKRISGRRARPTAGRIAGAGRSTAKRRAPHTRRGRRATTAEAPAAAEPAALQRPAPELSEAQRRYLRGLAHSLKPIVRLGNAGLTEAVATETARALLDHELIKVKAQGGGDREARDAVFAQLAERTSSALVQRIGNVAVLYRANPKLPRILIPDTPST